MHSEFTDLKPYSNGVIKLRVVVELEKLRPSTVRVNDKMGNSVLVSTEFPKMPPKCLSCGEFGHFRMRCPSPSPIHATLPLDTAPPTNVLSPGSSTQRKSSLAASPVRFLPDLPQLPSVSEGDQRSSTSGNPSVEAASMSLVRTKSLPLYKELSQKKPSLLEWVEVANRSSPKLKLGSSSSKASSVVPITSSQFAEEEEIISSAQRILRHRLAAVTVSNSVHSTSMSRKHARRKIRQQLYLLALKDTGDGSIGSPAVSTKSPGFGLASDGHAPPRTVHSQEA